MMKNEKLGIQKNRQKLYLRIVFDKLMITEYSFRSSEINHELAKV